MGGLGAAVCICWHDVHSLPSCRQPALLPPQHHRSYAGDLRRRLWVAWRQRQRLLAARQGQLGFPQVELSPR